MISILSFLVLHIHFILLTAYGVYSFVVANKSKPLGWLLLHCALVAAGGVLGYFRADIYFIAGGAISVGMFFKSWLIDKMPFNSLSAVLAYLKTAFNNAVVYPATVFDMVYNWIKSETKSS